MPSLFCLNFFKPYINDKIVTSFMPAFLALQTVFITSLLHSDRGGREVYMPLYSLCNILFCITAMCVLGMGTLVSLVEQSALYTTGQHIWLDE